MQSFQLRPCDQSIKKKEHGKEEMHHLIYMVPLINFQGVVQMYQGSSVAFAPYKVQEKSTQSSVLFAYTSESGTNRLPISIDLSIDLSPVHHFLTLIL